MNSFALLGDGVSRWSEPFCSCAGVSVQHCRMLASRLVAEARRMLVRAKAGDAR